MLGGWVFDRYGAGILFATAAVMALCNSAFALTVPKPSRERRAAKRGGRERAGCPFSQALQR